MVKIIPGQEQIKAPQQITDDYWTSTGGPPGADVFALLENSNGYLFRLARLVAVYFVQRMREKRGWRAAIGLTATDIRALAENSAGDIFCWDF